MTDLLVNDFTALLRAFNKLVQNEPKPESIKDKLSELVVAANNAATLTWRQRDAIVGRVNNYLTGEYKTRTKASKSEINKT